MKKKICEILFMIIAISLVLPSCNRMNTGKESSLESISESNDSYDSSENNISSKESSMPNNIQSESEKSTDSLSIKPSSVTISSASSKSSSTSLAPTPTAIPARQYYKSTIGMWYCVWWDSEEKDSFYYESHWMGETRIKPLRFGYYATDDIPKLEYDFNYFKKIGIDYLLLDDTNNHLADGGNIASHINTCFKTADALGTGKSPKLSFAGGSPLLNKNEEGMLAELDIFYSYSLKYPNTYFNWKGKPLFVNFNMPENFKYKDPKDRFTIRNSCGHTSEALGYATKYNLNTVGLFGWVFDVQYKGSEVYGINPGWSRSHNDFNWTGAAAKSRENGEKYTRMWLEAVKTNPETIVVASWNDHAEETGIEAVKLNEPIAGRENEYLNPYMYEQITEGYLALKTGYLNDFYYRAESASQIYKFSNGLLNSVSAIPTDRVLIIVPDDYYSWSGIQRK